MWWRPSAGVSPYSGLNGLMSAPAGNGQNRVADVSARLYALPVADPWRSRVDRREKGAVWYRIELAPPSYARGAAALCRGAGRGLFPRSPPAGPMTLISVDSGVTLAISMRRMLADRQWPMRLFLPSVPDDAGSGELQQILRAHPPLRVITAVSHPDGVAGGVGRFDAVRVTLFPALAQRHVYGAAGVMAQVQTLPLGCPQSRGIKSISAKPCAAVIVPIVWCRYVSMAMRSGGIIRRRCHYRRRAPVSEWPVAAGRACTATVRCCLTPFG